MTRDPAVARSNRRDWTDLHLLLDELPPGRWTYYEVLAQRIGSHPIAVGQHIKDRPDCWNAWRVMGKDGKVRIGFAWQDPSHTDDVLDVLREGGLRLSGDKADAAQLMRWTI